MFSDRFACDSRAKTQFFTSNISVAHGAYYNLSFRVKTTHDINISYINMMGMASPWPAYLLGKEHRFK